MRILFVLFASLLAATPALALYHPWGGSGLAGRFDDPKNWNINQADAFAESACRSGCESQIGNCPSGTYTISSDIWVNRCVLDRTNQSLIFDFGEHTAYFIGLDHVAFGATADANGESVYVTSGTVCIPSSFKVNGVEAITADRSFLGLPREKVPSLRDATIMADGDLLSGVHGTIDVRDTKLIHGTNNCIGARNGGVFKTGTISFNNNAGNSVSNHLTFANGGIWQNASASPTLLTLTFGGTANGHRVEFVDGGKPSGFFGFNISGGNGFRTIFSGADTKVKLEDATDVSHLNGVSNRFEVLNGAQVRLSNDNSKGKARFWLGTGTVSHGNVIRVDGEGSLFELPASGTLLGQHSGQGNGFEVSNHGEAIVNSVHIGQGEWTSAEQANPKTYVQADHNYMTVSSGGKLTDIGSMYVGYGGAPLCDSRLTVVSDGVVSNQTMCVGNNANANSNVVRVADGGRLLTKGNVYLAYGNPCSQGNRLTVGTDGTCVAGGDLTIGTEASCKTLAGASAGNVFEVLSNGVCEVGGRFVDYGRDTVLRVNGGVLRVKGMIILPYYNDGNTNLTVEISGAAPKIVSDSDLDYTVMQKGYAFSFRKWTHIKFKIPKQGWAEPPLQAPNGEIGIFGSSVLEFDLDEFLAANGGVGGSVVLADGRLANYGADVLEPSNKLLKEKYGVRSDGTTPKCQLMRDGQKLVLKTPSGKGLSVIVR